MRENSVHGGPRLTLERVRLYRSIRSAHLERAHDLGPATILFSEKRYDFDEALTAGLHLVRASPLGGALLLTRSNVTTLEINEPLMLDSLAASALALLALGLRRVTGRPRTTVVTYAIGNADPFRLEAAPRLRTRFRRRLERILARRVWQRVDRVAFGTSAARETYETVLGRVGARSSAMLIPALPSPWPTVDEGRRIDGRVVFVGALSERKGVRVLLEAWPLVHQARQGASLLIVGKGVLDTEVLTAAATGSGIDVLLDPGRTEIHDRLDEARVLVLPSQPSPTWREQVGLPIVEGLSHGLSIVTTEQTGLADWLEQHGHYVSVDASSATELANLLIRAIDDDRAPAQIRASLPGTDGRLSADHWLFSSTPTISDLTRVLPK